MTQNPLVSIILPVYNAAKTIAQTIDSILLQSFTDFEVIIINDGSIDETTKIIDSYSDSRVRHIHLPKNYGAIAATNLGLAEVDSPLIIRIDADSIALKDKFKIQVEFMQSHPKVGVCGTAVKLINHDSREIQNPEEHDAIVAKMIFENPIADSSVIFRSSLLREKGFRYRDIYPKMSEYDLWYRMRHVTVFANVPNILSEVIENNNKSEILSSTREIAISFYIEKLNDMGIQPDLKELNRHLDITNPAHVAKFSNPEKYRQWLDKLKTTNHIVYSFPRVAFDNEVEYRWKNLFSNIEKMDLDKAIHWLRLEGKSEPYIWKYKMKHKLGF
jgi:glycosyltransferase involved in cell wall biosynthesis